jgi:hypothetical protein
VDAPIASVQSLLAMFRTICICLVATLGCQGKSDGDSATKAPSTGAPPTRAAGVTPQYASDITKLCDVVKLSKADADPGGQVVIVANWLAAHLETKEAHEFLVRISSLGPQPKADALDAEAHKVGLASCALATTWRAPDAKGV